MLRSSDMALKVFIDGSPNEAEADECLVEAIYRSASKIPQVCYHPQLGPIQTCDACMVVIGHAGFFTGLPKPAQAGLIETSVRMLVLKEKSESPLPRGNHRFGGPTPQRGVEVERKWKLANYRPPGPPFKQ